MSTVCLLHADTSLTYATVLAFYLYLRSTPKYVARPELLRSHPIMNRLLVLKQSLTVMDEFDFDAFESDSDEDDEDDEDDTSDDFNDSPSEPTVLSIKIGDLKDKIRDMEDGLLERGSPKKDIPETAPATPSKEDKKKPKKTDVKSPKSPKSKKETSVKGGAHSKPVPEQKEESHGPSLTNVKVRDGALTEIDLFSCEAPRAKTFGSWIGQRCNPPLRKMPGDSNQDGPSTFRIRAAIEGEPAHTCV